MEIAVLGGGNGSYAAAAHLSEQGHSVRMWRRNHSRFSKILSSREIALEDWEGERKVKIDMATDDLSSAIKGAKLVLIPLPATCHNQLSIEVVPYLEDGQVVFFSPGTFGSYIFSESLRCSDNRAQVTFAETGTLPYLARKQSEEKVRISVYATRLPTGVYPSNRTAMAMETLSNAYPAVEPLRDALDGALMNAGPIIHPPLIILNAGPLEHFESWDIHNEGTQPSIRRVTSELDKERIYLREQLGYGEPHFPLENHYDDSKEEWMYGNHSHKKLTDSGDWREKIDLLTHRYMLEDVALGLSLWASIARWLNVDIPLATGILSISSAIVGRDLDSTGRTLENLGLAEFSKDTLNVLLREGVASE